LSSRERAGEELVGFVGRDLGDQRHELALQHLEDLAHLGGRAPGSWSSSSGSYGSSYGSKQAM
jgi:hypothetical protein